jgi:acetolactate synthase-1/3 small subunit
MSNQRHIITALVENRPGVLNRVVSLFRRRGFNLDSLTVGRAEQPEISRMTLVLEGTEIDAERAKRELDKLIQVIEVGYLSGASHLVRDVVLVKVTASPQTWPEILHVSQIYNARVVDLTPASAVLELTSDTAMTESFVDQLHPFGIVELVRSGAVAMARREECNSYAYQPFAWAATEHRPAGLA